MNCTFLSTVYSTILITEAIYIRKMICTIWTVRRWWCGWADFVLHFNFHWRPSLLIPGNAPTCRTTTELQIEPWKWFIIISLKMENDLIELLYWKIPWQNQSLWDFLTGGSYMWLLEPTGLTAFFLHVFTPVEWGVELWQFGEHPINFRWVCGQTSCRGRIASAHVGQPAAGLCLWYVFWDR